MPPRPKPPLPLALCLVALIALSFYFSFGVREGLSALFVGLPSLLPGVFVGCGKSVVGGGLDEVIDSSVGRVRMM